MPAYAADDIEAKAQLCAACHGENGVPIDPKTIPIIWGQQQSYLVKQLHDYRSGDRDNPTMSSIAKGLAQDDLRKIAAYFAAKAGRRKTRPPLPRRRPTESPSASHAISPISRAAAGAAAGRAQLRILVQRCAAFAAGERTNNGDMPKFMQALTDSERDAMARYPSAL